MRSVARLELDRDFQRLRLFDRSLPAIGQPSIIIRSKNSQRATTENVGLDAPGESISE
ncbi:MULTISPECIES: hypothetical protein [unclassified Mesorhizobium]|uniref:hypothetical protein n=1 Tax=unclassified Mesorhizobium TaxID=325217 RepID=UPI002416014D|nr:MULTISPECIES: hypothetical protein [unclassified Mesorhizobium]MDG4885736.1 hypothetical protein [Mesorhizobium sp. WSM4887]